MCGLYFDEARGSAMSKNVTMAEIGKKLGVSTVTVSKALSGQKGVSEELRGRILNTAVQMGYQKPQRKEQDETRTIGAVIAQRHLDKGGAFYWNLYHEISRQMILSGGISVLEVIGSEAERCREMPKIIAEDRADGLIVIGDFSREYTGMLHSSQKMPIVELDTVWREGPADAFVCDYFGGGYMMTRYLQNLGHTKIGFAGTSFMAAGSDERYYGYVKALTENGIRLREDWILKDGMPEGRFGKSGERSADGLPERPDEMPTAFCCSNDRAAAHLLRKLAAKGCRVPEDVSVVGFHDCISYEQEAELVRVTMYEPDRSVMAQLAVKRLLHKIENPGPPEGVMMAAGRIIERGSARKLSDSERRDL